MGNSLVALTNKKMNVSGGACLDVENIIPAQGLNHGPGRIDDSIEIKELDKSIKINLFMLLSPAKIMYYISVSSLI